MRLIPFHREKKTDAPHHIHSCTCFVWF